MSGDIKLLPCPFCGRDNVKTFGPYGWYGQFGISHSCSSFYSGTSGMMQGFPSATLAIAAWNARTPDPRIERLEAINASLIDQVSELSAAPWPKWAESLLSILRDWTGPCPEDASEGVDLPEELRIWLEGYRDELERVTITKALEGEAGNGAS